LADFGADGGEALGKLRGHQGTHGDALVVKLLELFELVGFESFEWAKNFLDGGLPRLSGVMLPILKGQVADRQLLQHFSGNYWVRLIGCDRPITVSGWRSGDRRIFSVR
jgi:hypothetical protein